MNIAEKARAEKNRSEKTRPEKNRRAEGGSRRAPKEVRRQQLIEATLDSLAKRGYAATTLADVADGAGLSRGIVNFYFASKEKLLTETLQYLADEYAAHWRTALEAAEESPAARVAALVAADFDAQVCTQRKVAAWFAFWGEAQTRPNYRELCWARDDDFLGELRQLCAALKAEGGYAFDPEKTAVAIYALLEGLWLRLMLDGRGYTRKEALESAQELLSSLFPRHFRPDGRPMMASSTT